MVLVLAALGVLAGAEAGVLAGAEAGVLAGAGDGVLAKTGVGVGAGAGSECCVGVDDNACVGALGGPAAVGTAEGSSTLASAMSDVVVKSLVMVSLGYVMQRFVYNDDYDDYFWDARRRVSSGQDRRSTGIIRWT